MNINSDQTSAANRAEGPKRRKRHAARKSRMAAVALSLTATGVLSASFAKADQANAATTTASSSTYLGVADSNRWGVVQVRLSVKGGKITDVTAVKLPNHRPKSVRLSTNAASVLRSTTLTTKSIPVDTISGASMTSRSYLVSLQSAIDMARAAGALR